MMHHRGADQGAIGMLTPSHYVLRHHHAAPCGTNVMQCSTKGLTPGLSPGTMESSEQPAGTEPGRRGTPRHPGRNASVGEPMGALRQRPGREGPRKDKSFSSAHGTSRITPASQRITVRVKASPRVQNRYGYTRSMSIALLQTHRILPSTVRHRGYSMGYATLLP